MLPFKLFISVFILVIYNLLIIRCQKVYSSVNFCENNTEFIGSIDNSIEYIFSCNLTDIINPARVTISSEDATRQFPILIVVRQQRQILSWQLPLIIDNMEFNNTSRTLCPDELNNTKKYKNSPPQPIPVTPSKLTVSITTASPTNLSFSLLILPENDFHITDTKIRHVTVSPSAPLVFFYQFPNVKINDTLDQTDTVLIQIDSDDNVCMFISVQNITCPVYDLEHDIRFEGYWETVNKRGGMNIRRSKFPLGFFIVFVSKSEDIECTGNQHYEPGVLNHNKKVHFSVTPGATKRDYLTAITVTISLAIIAHLLAWLLICFVTKRRPLTLESIEEPVSTIETLSPPTPTSTIPDNNEYLDDDTINSSMDETEYDTITEALSERHIYRSKAILYVCDLAKKPPRILQRKSYLYLWHVITVAVFYGLPVVQLVFTYQRVLADTGNQDLCYYNFLCAHPFGLLSDFNHVFSNIGYVVLGILFIGLVYRRERWHGFDANFDRHYGIPQHHGLFYAMGAALIMEGVLSASYHVCPNHTNFQFDSSFMYVMAVLCMVKIYQNRHPDINATAYATFGVLAAAICLGMIGILAGNIYFWIMFTILHLLTCLLLTVQIYYMGCWKCDRGMFMRVFRMCVNDFRSGPVNVIKPVYKGRMALLVLGNVSNWALAIIGLLHHDRDFATYLLAIFMSNTLLYTIFYIVMKILHKERITIHAICFILLATATWSAAMYFFINKSISWALTPAMSRQYNQPCKLFHFYDPHDIWHFLSAIAMFFSFMILLTLDDDLTHTHRSKIHVF